MDTKDSSYTNTTAGSASTESATDAQKPRGGGIGGRIAEGMQRKADGLASGGAPLFFTMLLTLLVTVIACVAVFFASLQGEEKVMVPDVVGKSLTTALLEMQQKELYPKIQLRYSDEDDALTILEQDPEPGAIVKAYRRVTLTVSRGQEGSGLEDFTGKNIDDVLPGLRQNPLVTLAPPVYKKDARPAGTILAQTPQGGSPLPALEGRTKVQLIVSRGQEEESAQVPDLAGMKVPDTLKALSSAKVIFDFTSHEADAAEKAGTVTGQQGAGQTMKQWSHVEADFAFAPAKEGDPLSSGIFSAAVGEYPYPVPMTATASSQEGKTTVLARFYHDGGKVSLPYTVEKGSTITLYALDREIYSAVVN